jgi:plasmid stabilization system protein ParE
MPPKQIRYLPEARLDLIEMGDYYQQAGGSKLARQMVSGVKKEIGLLSNFPERPPEYELAPGVRRLVVAKGAFLVFFRLTKYIEIVHVRRAEREPVAAEFLEGIKA